MHRGHFWPRPSFFEVASASNVWPYQEALFAVLDLNLPKKPLDLRFRAAVPAFPGCYSQDETVDELKHNIRAAGVLEVPRKQGREPDTNI